MGSKVEAELKQARPFETVEAEAYVNILRTADALARPVEQVLEHAGLSSPQYNVLRILRGAGTEGLACREIGERMIARDRAPRYGELFAISSQRVRITSETA